MAGIDSSISIEMDSYNTEEVEKLHRLMNARALRKKRIRKTVLVCVNILFALFMLFPLLYSVSVSIMPGDELFTMDLNILPSNPTFENYVRAFTQVPLVRFILNSFLVAGCITIGQIITCSLAAFAFSFLEFKGKNFLFMLVMATMMVPGEAVIISNYLTVSSMGILDTYIHCFDPPVTDIRNGNLFVPSVLYDVPDFSV